MAPNQTAPRRWSVDQVRRANLTEWTCRNLTFPESRRTRLRWRRPRLDPARRLDSCPSRKRGWLREFLSKTYQKLIHLDRALVFCPGCPNFKNFLVGLRVLRVFLETSLGGNTGN